MNRHPFLSRVVAATGIFSLSLVLRAEQPGWPDSAIFRNLKFRNVGPGIMGGRVAAVEGVAGNPNVIYVGAAAGGIFKTVNGGISWKPVFDRQGTASIGAIAVAPSNPSVVYAGTGEGNPRNSASIGDGVYRSTDGGETWTRVGLTDTETIHRIRVHPTDPNTVWVAAMGHKWGPNQERGLFRTTDGGRTWVKVLYIDENTGASDVEIDYSNPRYVYAALYELRRTPYSFISGGPGSGIYRSVDGGATFVKLTKGLPTGLLGRIGLASARSKPGTVCALVESNEGILYRSGDYGQTWTLVNSDPDINTRPFYYTDIVVDPKDENRLYILNTPLRLSTDSGRTWKVIGEGIHGDHHALWIDPTNPMRVLNGNDGGFHISYDRAENWEFVNSFAIGQFYHVDFNMKKPYWVGGGLQDNGTWIGPSQTTHEEGILNDDWIQIGLSDGFAMLWQDDDTIFLNSEGGDLRRVDIRTGEMKRVVPYPPPFSGSSASELKYRFNWNAPLAISPHDRRVIYLAANVVFKTTDQGQTWQIISPDLTTNDPSKMKPSGGPITRDNTTAEYHCTITALAESPITAGLIWIGTDDGNVQITRDGGRTWTKVVQHIKGLPSNSWVPMIEASRFNPSIAYAVFDRHRSNDMRPYVFKTTDYGQTWTNVTGDLPEFGYAWVVREDLRNQNLLYLGTELGLYLTFDGGRHWMRYPDLPTMPVNGLVLHPRENDLILGTHGRGIFILDDLTALQQISEKVLVSDAHLFDIRPAMRFQPWRRKTLLGQKAFRAENPPYGALITYYLKATLKQSPVITVVDSTGAVIRQFTGTNLPGINRVAWDLRHDDAWRPEGQPPDRYGPRGGPQVLPGDYVVKLKVGDSAFSKTVRVELHPEIQVSREELGTQLATLLRLREMRTAANRAIQRIMALQKELEAIPPSTARAPDLENLMKRLVDQRARFIREGSNARMQKPAQLEHKITTLAASVDGTTAGPTGAELEYLEQYDAVLKRELAELEESEKTFQAIKLPAGRGNARVPPGSTR